MAWLIHSEHRLGDLARLTDFLIEIDPLAVAATIGLIAEAVGIFKRYRWNGRAVENCLRELVISRGRTGYVAVYNFEENADAILILAIRHHREAGYASPGRG